MTWKVVWSSFAEQQIADIFNYYCDEASKEVAKKIVTGIIKAPNGLLKNPELGQQELMLSELETQYRYILYKSYKVTSIPQD